MRLIDADELKEEMLEESDWWENADVWVAHNVIDKAPTVVPAKRGEWVEDICYEEVIICNACGNEAYFDLDKGTYINFDYCPNCGAKMESDDKE